jgi:L-fuconolactonase
MNSMFIDAHQHVWTIGRGDYFWLAPDLPIYRDYGIADLRPLLNDGSGTVLVQAAPTEAETTFLLKVAENASDVVRAVVGWTDLAAPDAPEKVAELALLPTLKGLRPMLGFIEDTGWILRPEVQPALSAMTRVGMRLDFPARVRHLALLPELVQRHPGLSIVIDHAAKPAIARREFQPWADEILRVARETPVFCKISGLVTEARPDWNSAELRPYVEHLLDCFGPQRLMWGSDWPVVDLAGGFVRWREAALRLVPTADRDAVFGSTAARFYGLCNL